MRKMVAHGLVSLDAVAEEPPDFIVEFDEVMREHLGPVIAARDVVLLGRRTYDEGAAFWPTSDIEPFAGFINTGEKCVVTSTVPEAPWAPTTIIDGGLVDAVGAMKQQSGADIGVHVSIAPLQSLLAGGLADELRLVVAPALQGRSRRLSTEGRRSG